MMKIPDVPQVPFDGDDVERWWRSRKLDRLIIVFAVIDIVFLLTLPISTAFHVGVPQWLSNYLEQIPLFADHNVWVSVFFTFLCGFANCGTAVVFFVMWFRPDYRKRVGNRFLICCIVIWLLSLPLLRFFVYDVLSLPGAHYGYDRRRIFDSARAVGSCIFFCVFLIRLRMTRPKPETEPPAASTGLEGQS